MRLKTQHLIISVLVLLSAPTLSTYGQEIKNLEFLIGTWEVSEVIYPGTSREFMETGTRTCEYYVNETYIRCVTEAENKYRERTYVMMINYDKRYDKYIVTTSFSDQPFQGIYHWYLDSANQTIQSISPLDKHEDEFYRGEIKVSNEQLVWRGFKTPLRKEKIWEAVYIETSKKIG